MLRTTTSQLLSRQLVQRPIVMTTARPQSTLNTGEVLEILKLVIILIYLERVFKLEVLLVGGILKINVTLVNLPYKALAQLALAAGVFTAAVGIIYKTYPERPAVKRTYPYEGLKESLGYREGDIRPRGARPDDSE
ncbi:unnamed protein product [Cunninghamella echinulata]